MREISILKRRILEFLEKKGLSKYECYKSTGITNGVLSQTNGMSEENLLRFLSCYSDINPYWLLMGEGEILASSQSKTTEPQSTELVTDISVYHNLYREEKAENKALIEEIGALKLTIRQQEETILGLQATKGTSDLLPFNPKEIITKKPVSSSQKSSLNKNYPAASANALSEE